MFPRFCANRKNNEREVTAMKQYILDIQMGTMQEEPKEVITATRILCAALPFLR